MVKTVGSLSGNVLKWSSKLNFIVAPGLACFNLHVIDDPFQTLSCSLHLDVHWAPASFLCTDCTHLFIYYKEINDQMYQCFYKAYQIHVFYSHKLDICNISASLDSWWFGSHLIYLRLFLRDQMSSRGLHMISRKHDRPGISDL